MRGLRYRVDTSIRLYRWVTVSQPAERGSERGRAATVETSRHEALTLGSCFARWMAWCAHNDHVDTAGRSTDGECGIEDPGGLWGGVIAR